MICLNDYTLVKCLIAPNRCGSITIVDDEEVVGPQNLVIGTLALDTDYEVLVYREETDVLIRVTATADGAGLLTINLMDFPANFFRPFNVYYLWVVIPGANLTDRENITIDAIAYTLFKIEFTRIQEYDATDELNYDVATATQSIEPII